MSASRFCSRVFRFDTGLVPPRVLKGIEVVNPYADRRVPM